MAIYYLSLKHGSRGKNKRAGAHLRYIARLAKYKYNSDQVKFISFGNLPSWVKTPVHFWDMADKFSMKNARLYSEFEAALPRELNTREQIELALEFVDLELKTHHPFTLVIHDSPAIDGLSHPHFHLMFSTKKHDGIERDKSVFFAKANPLNPKKGGVPKDRSWIHKSRLEAARKLWETLVNEALARAGVAATVDCRSLRAQGIDREPQPRLTQFETVLYRQGIVTPKIQKILDLRKLARNQ
ncbi:MAG: MobA/MobL family protein [Leptolyngbya sp. SIO3F4]|nr:MobA/MobL family protein [Leptolyngbya sp. SIO3F4]